LAFTAAAFGQAGPITEYPVPTARSTPFAITAGPDGALWFTESASGKVGRITLSGAVTEFPGDGALGSIVSGPDGALWFTTCCGPIGRLTTSGIFTQYPIPFPYSATEIAAGPDGALWLTEQGGDGIGRVTTSGSITEYTIPNRGAGPVAITTGPDGALWFTESDAGKIGRVTTAGSFAEYTIPTSSSSPDSIAAGPDGALWFTEYAGNQIGRITTSGAVTEYALGPNKSPICIRAGPDGALWFAENSGNAIGRITTSGSIAEYPVPTAGASPGCLAVGADGALWFTEESANQIGRIVLVNPATPGLIVAKSHTGNFTQGQQGATYSVTVSNLAGSAASSGTVTVTENVPAGLTLVSMAGTGWSCSAGAPSGPCTRSDVLAGGASYPPITVTVNVSANAGSQVSNVVTVSGGGSVSASATDATRISVTGAGTISQFNLPSSFGNPFGIAAGSDGALWFTSYSGSAIGRMTLAGSVSSPIATGGPAQWIVPGPDGALWFTDTSGKIGRVTTGGNLTEYALPSSLSPQWGIAAGPDGALWFNALTTIGRITTSGSVSQFAFPTTTSNPSVITMGPDGALWYVECAGRVGKMTPTGAVTEYNVPTTNVCPGAIAAGPDGALWFTEGTANKIGRITTTGAYSEYAVPTVNSNPSGIVAGPDGAMWFGENHGNNIGRITTSGAISEYAIPVPNAYPGALAVGADGAIWFTENGGQIGRIDTGVTSVPALSIAKSHSGVFVQGQQNASYTLTVSNAPGAAPVSGTVTVTDTPQAGLTVTGIAGTGWLCTASLTCTRSDSLIGGTTYPPITVTANVAGNAPSPLVNVATAYGSGSALAGMADPATVDSSAALLSIAKSHSGAFSAGQTGVIYTVTVSNASPAVFTGGLVTVTENLPSGLALVSMAGSGWTCPIGNTCTRSDGLAGSASYPPIAVTVNVAGDAPSPQVNRVSVSAPGAAVATASDSTAIDTALVFIQEFAVPTAGSQPNAIVAGPDGALWFTEFHAGKIGRITVTGAITEYPIATPACGPFGLAAGPDGLLWFTEANAGKIGKITTGGNITEYALSNSASEPLGIAAGPNGVLWFTEAQANKVGWINTAGSPIAEYPIPIAGSFPYAIAAGPDGAIWFSEAQTGQIGRVANASIAEFNATDPNSVPLGITMGPDGALWFSEWGFDQIDRMTTAGSITEYLVTSGGGPEGITAGPDGALWFAETDGNNIGRLTTGGTLAEYPLPTPAASPVSVAVGADNAIWFTEQNGNRIGRLITGSTAPPALSIAVSHSGNFAQGQQNATYTVTVSNAAGAAAAAGTINVTEALPSGLTLVALSGTGWTCGGNGCTRGDGLAGGASFPPITVTVDVGAGAPSPQVNVVTVSGGGSLNASDSDSTTIIALPALGITEAQTGNFTAGQQGVYTVTVSNAAGADAAQGVEVTDTLPSGMTLVSMAGTGWTCGAPAGACRRGDSLAGGASYPPITITVSVAANAASPEVNTVSVSGSGFAAVSASYSTIISTALAFYPVTPCRVADTRSANGPFGGPSLSAGSIRSFAIPSSACNIPATAQAYSLNITVAPPAALAYLTAWPAGQTQPYVSTLNSSNGAIVANAAIVPAGTGGAVSIYVSDSTHAIIDINGYFAAPGSFGALAFYPSTPCRVADTRNANSAFGGPSLAAGATRNFAAPSSSCGIPSSAQAYSLNMTVVPPGPLRYLTTWPAGQPQPYVSTLNALQGQIAANAAIVPAGGGATLGTGAISVFVSDASNVIIDINGYFAPPGNPGALYFYPVIPCRVVDTRNAAGTFGGPALGSGATRNFPVAAGSCGLPSAAQAYSFNMTVVPPGPLLFLSGWPAGQSQPVVSTLNDLQAQVVANAAIVPAGAGAISVFVSDATNLIIDVNGYFGQ